MTFSPSHAGLAGYLLRARIAPGPRRPDGAVALVFDGSSRVLLHTGRRGELNAESELCLLGRNRDADDRTMLDALRAAASRPSHESSRLVLSPQEDCLLLQDTIPADASSDQFENLLSRFLGSLNAWRAHFGTL
jgi:hypothetical protein